MFSVLGAPVNPSRLLATMASWAAGGITRAFCSPRSILENGQPFPARERLGFAPLKGALWGHWHAAQRVGLISRSQTSVCQDPLSLLNSLCVPRNSLHFPGSTGSNLSRKRKERE